MIYLDYAATTPLAPRVFDATQTYSLQNFGYPSSIFQYGQLAKKGVENAREQIAMVLSYSNDEIVFTSGGSECGNLASCGVALTERKRP